MVTDNFILYKKDTCRNDVFTSLWVFDSRNLCILGKYCTTELQPSLRVAYFVPESLNTLLSMNSVFPELEVGT